MASLTVENNTYKVESLYQWDKNQVLTIYGLSLATIPEIHFTNEAMDRAIVRQASMDSAGVITVNIPDSLLQNPYKLTVYVCIYERDTFETVYKMTIPVKARKRPTDYTFSDADGEIYSFNTLENLVLNTVNNTKKDYNASVKALNEATNKYEAVVLEYNRILDKYAGLPDRFDELENTVEENKETLETQVKENYDELKEHLDDCYNKDEVLSPETKSRNGLSDSATPDDMFNVLEELSGSLALYLTLSLNENDDARDICLGKNNEENIKGLGRALAMYAKFKDPTITSIEETFPNLILCDSLNDLNKACFEEINGSNVLRVLFSSNDYAITSTWDSTIFTAENPQIFTFENTKYTSGYSGEGGVLSIRSSYTLSSYPQSFTLTTIETFSTNGAKYLYLKASSANRLSTITIVGDTGEIKGEAKNVGSYLFDVSNFETIRLKFQGDGFHNGISAVEFKKIFFTDLEVITDYTYNEIVTTE